MQKTSLWKYNKITGFWEHQRDCLVGYSEAWLKIFQEDAPGEYFKLSKTKPKKAPSIN